MIACLEPTALRVIALFAIPTFSIGTINHVGKTSQTHFNPSFSAKPHPPGIDRASTQPAHHRSSSSLPRSKRHRTHRRLPSAEIKRP